MLACIYYEFLRAKSPFAYAASAHLGGLAAGYLYHRVFNAPRSGTASGAASSSSWLSRKSSAAVTTAPDSPSPASRREALRAEVDRILDKINVSGLASLTLAERRLLDEAKALLTKG